MCFGSTQTTQTQNYTPPAWLTSAAQNNVNFGANLQNTGFTPYTGNQVAAFSPQQQQSFGLGGQLAGGISPYVGETGGLISNYANAGPQSVTPQTIAQNMSPYMNQYVGLALQPQLAALKNQESLQSQLTQGQATSAGAFGDPRATMLQQNQNFLSGLQNAGVVGNAYNSAFNTAIGAGAQDVANNLAGQTTNANLAETALARQLQGANALNSVGTGATNLENTLGGQQTAQTQQQLNAAYNQWLMGQQFPFQTMSANDQALMAARGAVPTTQTTSAPNNAGYGLLGAGLGALGTVLGGPIGGMVGSGIGNAFNFATSGGSPTGNPDNWSDKRLKENIKTVGETPDHIPVKTFNFKADPAKTQHLGLIAQDVEKKRPEAVHADPATGMKKVNYAAALAPKNAHGVTIPPEVLDAARKLRAKKGGSSVGLSKQLGVAA